MNVCHKCGDRLSSKARCLACDDEVSRDYIRYCAMCNSQIDNPGGPCWSCAEDAKQKAIDEAILGPKIDPPGVSEMARMMQEMMVPPSQKGIDPKQIKGYFKARTFYRGIAFLSLMSRGHPINDNTVDMAIQLGDKLSSRSGDE